MRQACEGVVRIAEVARAVSALGGLGGTIRDGPRRAQPHGRVQPWQLAGSKNGRTIHVVHYASIYPILLRHKFMINHASAPFAIDAEQCLVRLRVEFLMCLCTLVCYDYHCGSPTASSCFGGRSLASNKLWTFLGMTTVTAQRKYCD